MPAKRDSSKSRVSGIAAAALRGARKGDAKPHRTAHDARTVSAEKARQITGGKKSRG